MVETVNRDITARLLDFAWEQWSQLGVSGATPARRESRAADPEALLLFTLEIGRHDPRLFDEVLDWLVLNESLVSVQRLRNLCLDETDRALVDGALNWVARWRPRARLSSKPARDAVSPQPLFVGLSTPGGAPEPSFARVGLLRPEFAPSEKSQAPDLAAPISFAFRLRRFLGIGVRAEVVRALLTVDAPRMSAAVVHASAGFTRQNVRETLTQLRDSGLADVRGHGGDRQYWLRRVDWTRLLHIEGPLPEHHDWIQTLGPLRLVLRWLWDEDAASMSDYMRASEARALLSRLEPDLRFAGYAVGGRDARGADFWEEFGRAVDGVVSSL